MLTRRKLLVGFGLGMLAPVVATLAQQGKIPRIGILSARYRSTPSSPDLYFDAFSRGMQELGYIDGKNIVIEWRIAEGRHERLASLGAELIRLKVDVIVCNTTQAAQEIQRATSTIPIVMTSSGDPVGAGLAKSLSRPGGNATGLTIITIDLSAKQIEYLKFMSPKVSQLAAFMNPTTPFHAGVLKSIQAAAKTKGMQVLPVYVGKPEEIERAFEKISQERATAAFIPADSLFTLKR